MATYLPIGIRNKIHVQKACESYKNLNSKDSYINLFNFTIDKAYPGDDWDGDEILEILPICLVFETCPDFEESNGFHSWHRKEQFQQDVYAYVTGFCDGMLQ